MIENAEVHRSSAAAKRPGAPKVILPLTRKAGMSKYPVGRYRDRVGVNIEAVYNKTVKKG
jgi:hypothetical protein